MGDSQFLIIKIMISNIFFQTLNKNHYLMSLSEKLILPVHPVFQYIVKQMEMKNTG